MIWASLILSVICMILFIQIALQYLNERCKLKLQVKHGIICSKEVLVVTVLTVVVAALFIWQRWDAYVISQIVLQIFLLIGMAVLTVTDYKIRVVPNRFLFLMLGVWLAVIGVTAVTHAEVAMTLVLQGILGASVAAAIFGVCYLLSRRQLGGGDVKLAIVMGLYMTPPCSICSYLIGTSLCCIVSLILIMTKKLGWKDSIPMVPFLTIGMWIALFLIK